MAALEDTADPLQARLRANDRHRHWVPVVVIGALLLMAYLWTDWMRDYPLPGVEALADTPLLEEAFSRGHLRNSSWMHRDSDLDRDVQRRLLLLLAGIAFLLAYYLPPRFKRPPVAVVTCAGIAWALGPGALGLMLGWHLLAYLVFHAPAPRRTDAFVAIVGLVTCWWLPILEDDNAATEVVLRAAVTAPIAYLLYRHGGHALLLGRAGPWLRTLTAHLALVYLAVALAFNWQAGDSAFIRPLGLLMFLWQWERLVMYHIDLKDGRVPPDLGLPLYLATFLSPATISNFHWLSRIPLGYAYLADSFLARDKNRIVLSGLWLMALAVLFFALRPVVLELIERAVEWLGHEPLTRYSEVVEALSRGTPVSAVSAWCALISAFMSFYLLWTAVAHLKVGLWRLFGYDIEPYFQKPFLSTNLVELWKRYSYYYREFLVRAFYYPVFLRYFKRQPRLRIFAASMAAAGLGNLLYHLVYASLFYGATPEVIGARLATWPYYILLGTGIALTQIYLLARGANRRRPWRDPSRFAYDLMAMLGTIGFFILIRPFHHVPKEDSSLDALGLVLAAFGLG